MDLSHDLTSRMPIVPHETAGVDCGGCIIAAVDGTNVELRCNECGAVVGVVHLDILKGLLGLECATATCPHLRQGEHVPRLHEGVDVRVCGVREGGRIGRTGFRSGVGRHTRRYLHLVRIQRRPGTDRREAV
jgi:hypothetical protein